MYDYIRPPSMMVLLDRLLRISRVPAARPPSPAHVCLAFASSSSCVLKPTFQNPGGVEGGVCWNLCRDEQAHARLGSMLVPCRACTCVCWFICRCVYDADCNPVLVARDFMACHQTRISPTRHVISHMFLDTNIMDTNTLRISPLARNPHRQCTCLPSYFRVLLCCEQWSCISPGACSLFAWAPPPRSFSVY